MAAYWDWFNGVYHQLDRIPTPEGTWNQFFHPTYPLLSFLYPPTYTATTIAEGTTVGVDLVRNDGAGRWQTIALWGDVTPGASAWRCARCAARRSPPMDWHASAPQSFSTRRPRGASWKSW